MMLLMQLGMKFIIEITHAYNYNIALMILVSKHILKRNKMMKDKNADITLFLN